MRPLIDHDIKNGKLTQLRLSMGDVLNGIVYIPEKKSFILTGKLWDYYYEVVFDQKQFVNLYYLLNTKNIFQKGLYENGDNFIIAVVLFKIF